MTSDSGYGGEPNYVFGVGNKNYKAHNYCSNTRKNEIIITSLACIPYIQSWQTYDVYTNTISFKQNYPLAIIQSSERAHKVNHIQWYYIILRDWSSNGYKSSYFSLFSCRFSIDALFGIVWPWFDVSDLMR